MRLLTRIKICHSRYTVNKSKGRRPMQVKIAKQCYLNADMGSSWTTILSLLKILNIIFRSGKAFTRFLPGSQFNIRCAHETETTKTGFQCCVICSLT